MRENMIKGFYGMMAGIVAFVPSVLAAADVVEPPKPFSPTNWDWTSILYIALALLIVFVCARAFDIAKVTETSTGKKVIDWFHFPIYPWLALANLDKRIFLG